MSLPESAPASTIPPDTALPDRGFVRKAVCLAGLSPMSTFEDPLLEHRTCLMRFARLQLRNEAWAEDAVSENPAGRAVKAAGVWQPLAAENLMHTASDNRSQTRRWQTSHGRKITVLRRTCGQPAAYCPERRAADIAGPACTPAAPAACDACPSLKINC